jgi:hypothetical protein
MKSSTNRSCTAILSKVEEIMDSVDVARLTNDQYAEIKRLKQELEAFCAVADSDGASRTERRIVAIVKEGPPGFG